MESPPTLEEILFLDIETVPAFKTLSEVPEPLREIWVEQNAKKRKKKSEDDDGETSSDSNYGDAGLKGEFGRIICISLGRFEGGTEESNFKTHSISGHDEKELLTQFAKVLTKYQNHKLCAHNGKGFDFPFLGKRFLINGLPLPSQLNLMGKKPWDVPHIDTQELWSFGSKAPGGASLKLLCAVFAIPSPKDDISGADVKRVYYEEKDLPRIVKYCEKDVVSLMRVYRKMVPS
jgi:predicted PolB exonuclease-like 3'-5' exonuclease